MNTRKVVTAQELDDLTYSSEYADYIMANAGGERVICNGHTLLAAMEDLYLFDAFLDSIGVEETVPF